MMKFVSFKMLFLKMLNEMASLCFKLLIKYICCKDEVKMLLVNSKESILCAMLAAFRELAVTKKNISREICFISTARKTIYVKQETAIGEICDASNA